MPIGPQVHYDSADLLRFKKIAIDISHKSRIIMIKDTIIPVITAVIIVLQLLRP